MSLLDVFAYHTPMVIVNLTNGGFLSANPGGYARPLSPMENPEEIEVEKGADWDGVQIPGTSHPRYQFVSGAPRIVRFKLEFAPSLDLSSIKRLCNQIESWEYPTHSGTVLLRPPPVCMIVMGMMFPGIKVIFPYIRAKYHTLFEAATLYSLRATVDVVAHEWVEGSVSYPTGSLIGGIL